MSFSAGPCKLIDPFMKQVDGSPSTDAETDEKAGAETLTRRASQTASEPGSRRFGHVSADPR